MYLCILLCIMLCLSGCRQADDLKAWGLPSDLPERIPQLTVLKLPQEVTHLEWMPAAGLESLDISGSKVSFFRVPWGLQRLDISRVHEITLLSTGSQALPSSLRELNMSYTVIHGRGKWKFPEHLESLTLGGSNITTLKGLNGTLLALKLEGVPSLASLEGLPPSVQSLSIVDAPALQDLAGLPPRLKLLTLKVIPNIRALKGLPETLQSLNLENNASLAQVEIPHNLVHLRAASVSNLFINLTDLRFLERLEMPELARFPAGPPQTLRSLALGDSFKAQVPFQQGLTELQWLEGDLLSSLPCELRSLDIRRSQLSTMALLPPCLRGTLTGLDISRTSIAIRDLPRGLKKLTFRFYPEPRITGLRAHLPHLRELDVSGSLALARIDELPDGLLTLNVGETRLTSLPPLPPLLRELDISNTRIKSLAGLKEGLVKLVVHEGQLETLEGLPDSVRELSFVGKKG